MTDEEFCKNKGYDLILYVKKFPDYATKTKPERKFKINKYEYFDVNITDKLEFKLNIDKFCFNKVTYDNKILITELNNVSNNITEWLKFFSININTNKEINYNLYKTYLPNISDDQPKTKKVTYDHAIYPGFDKLLADNLSFNGDFKFMKTDDSQNRLYVDNDKNILFFENNSGLGSKKNKIYLSQNYIRISKNSKTIYLYIFGYPINMLNSVAYIIYNGESLFKYVPILRLPKVIPATNLFAERIIDTNTIHLKLFLSTICDYMNITTKIEDTNKFILYENNIKTNMTKVLLNHGGSSISKNKEYTLQNAP